ncbi:MAG: hypothetical protein ACK4ND_16560 [Cytophagaceae bacterium]
MPGLSFIYQINNNIIDTKTRILDLLDTLLYAKYFEKKVLIDTKKYFLCFTGYSEYPLVCYENDNFLIYLEGKIYGLNDSAIYEQLINLSKKIFCNERFFKDHITDWLLENDGEFIIFILNKHTNDVAILNDIMGLLPLYYFKSDKKIIISREIGFISNLIDCISFDSMAIAQYLLFGYPLGNRTLYDKIFRFEPATLIIIKPTYSKLEINNIHQFNFDEKAHAGKSMEENAANLSLLFSSACRDRANSMKDFTHVLSLSGGLDSRAVGAGLKRNNIPFRAMTYLNDNRGVAIDAEIAKQVSKLYDINFSLCKLRPPTGNDYLKLLHIKNGLNSLAMSFILPFFENLREKYGPRVVYFTGDMGLATMKNNSPLKKFKNIDELIDYIFKYNSLFSLSETVNLVRIEEDEIREDLRCQLLSYPEFSLSQKYVHFMIYGKAINWGFEGIDRNRYYFWTATPLLSNKVFSYSMNCPDNQKGPHKLYKHFFINLFPEAAEIIYGDYMVPITSRKIIFKKFISSIYSNKLPSGIKNLVRKYLFNHWKPYEENSIFTICLTEQLTNCNAISEYLDIQSVKNKIKNINRGYFHNLFTIVSLIERITNRKSTFENYRNSFFVDKI